MLSRHTRPRRGFGHTLFFCVFAMFIGMPNLALAQSQSDPLETSALAIAAFEASKERCSYSTGVGVALAKIDELLTRSRRYDWERIKPTGEAALSGLRNRARFLGSASECATYGTAVGYILPVAFGSVDLDVALVEELSRLLKGEGQSRLGEADARPPQAVAPGSAAATIAELNQQHSTTNQSADAGSRASTLRRLPADSAPAAPLSQPPSRQSAEPVARPDRAVQPQPRPVVPLPPLTQVPPPVAPPSVAPPAASSSSDCRVAGNCRLAQPTFACNLDDAARIAEAGPEAGRQAGLAAVRGGTCEIVAAGRSLQVEATKAPNVVYAAEGGRHVGYLPVGVFAPADQAGTIACRAPGFCAVRPGAPAWICQQPAGLDQPTPEAKRAMGCLQVSSNLAVEVAPATGSMVALLNMVGGSPPVPTRFYAAHRDLVGLGLSPTPTPTWRGWCRPGDWCVISVAALFCLDRTAHDRVMNLPAGEARRMALMAEPACRLLIPGNVLKPNGVPTANDPRQLIEVEHPVLKTGWASAKAFKVVAYHPPLRYTTQLSDFAVSITHGASLVAVSLKGQGSETATATFRSGAKERLAFCAEYEGEENVEGFRSCFDQPDRTITLQANCYAKRLAFDGRTYQLRERPGETPRWQFLDLSQNLRADPLPGSPEPIIRTGFSALCPGANPDAGQEVVFRDSDAAFPQELRGRWFADRRACADPGHHQDDYEGYAWMEFGPQTRTGTYGYEFLERINAVRSAGRGAWEIDSSHRIDDATVPEVFQSGTYRLTRDGFVLRQQGQVSEWVRCR